MTPQLQQIREEIERLRASAIRHRAIANEKDRQADALRREAAALQTLDLPFMEIENEPETR